MEERILTNTQIQNFSDYLIREEKSTATCEKYLRDVRSFTAYVDTKVVSKELVVAWKKNLVEQGYEKTDIIRTVGCLHNYVDGTDSICNGVQCLFWKSYFYLG